MSHFETTLARIAEIQRRFQSPTLNGPSPKTSGSEGFADVLAGLSDSSDSPVPGADAIKALIEERADAQGVDANLVKAMVQAESNFNPNAVSPVGAQGLMQLMPGTASSLGVKNSFDPIQNVDGGIKYLKGLIGKYQSLPKAIAAYNAGPGAVDKHNGIPPYAETQHYTKKVLSLYAQYNQQTNGGPDS